MTLGFRNARAGDVDAILELMGAYYREDGYAFDRAAAGRAVRRLLEDATLGCLWVAADGALVVGYLAVTLGFSLEYQGRDAFVDELFIADSYRGRGLGRAALALAEAYCAEQGVRALHLEVERHRASALVLYRSGGFEEHGRRLMTKPLPG